MILTNSFHIDNSQSNSLKCISGLKKFIEDFTYQDIYEKNVIKFSNLLDCDSEPFKLKSKKIILDEFDFKKNKFNNFSSIIQIITSFLIFTYIILLTIFSFKKKDTKKVDLILVNVGQIDEIEKFKKVLSNFNSAIITDKKFDFNNTKNNISDLYLKENLNLEYDNKFLHLSYRDKEEKISIETDIKFKKKISFRSESITRKFKLLSFGVNLFLISLIQKFNFFKIYNKLLYSYVSNYSIFKKFNAKYLIQDRIFSTCPVRNYVFKKLGGKTTSCVQSHITEASISLFNDTDFLFTFGNEQFSKNFLIDLGSRVQKSFPIGSLRAESFYVNSAKNFHVDEKIDILIFGVNLFNWLYLNKNTYDNYYNFIKLMGEVSKKYDNLNIFLKHHSNNFKKIDWKEREIIKNTRIKYLNSFTNTYTYIKNTKLFFSFSSTMILETCGLVGRSYFIDPNNNNFVFFDKNKNLNKIKLNSMEDIDSIIKNHLLDKKDDASNLDDICLNSLNASKLIVSKIRENYYE